MTILAVGGESDTFRPNTGQAYAIETTTGRYVATLSRHAMKIVNAVSELYLVLPGGAVTEMWLHIYMYQEAVGTQTEWMSFVDGSGNTLYAINMESDGSWALRKNLGGFSTLVTSASPVLVSGAASIDIHIKRHASSGEFTVYKNGVSVATFSGDTSTTNSNWDRILFSGQVGASNELNISQVIVADEDTRNMVLATLAPTGNGANTDWVGDYEDAAIAEYDVGAYLVTPIIQDVETFTKASINAAWNSYNTVKAVVVGMLLSASATSDTSDSQAALRVAGTNYFSSDLGISANETLQQRQSLFTTNPATSAAWSRSAVNAMQFGIKSVT